MYFKKSTENTEAACRRLIAGRLDMFFSRQNGYQGRHY